jgi:ankyrin repeat protein
MYLDCGIDVNATFFHRQTALHVACIEGSADMIQLLKQVRGIRLDTVDGFGKRAEEYLTMPRWNNNS